MAGASRLGQMEPGLLDIGKKTGRMGLENSLMWMGMSTKENGPTIKQTDAAFTGMLMAHNMTASGGKICSTERELKPGLIKANIWVITPVEESTELGATSGMMEASMLESGLKTKFQAWEFTAGLTVECTKASGRTTTWRVLGFTNGTTVVNMKDSTKTTKSMGTVSMFGLMVGSIRAIGTEENNMELELTTCQKIVKPSADFGKTESG
jgi:hypothetical protein